METIGVNQTVVVRATDSFGLYVESTLIIEITDNSMPYISNTT